MSGGRQPDYDVAALNKETDEKGNVGAAWINEDGTISIKLNVFTAIRGGPAMLVTLFPRERNKDGTPKRKKRDDDGDIPY